MGIVLTEGAEATAATGGGSSFIIIILLYAAVFGGMYFIFMRPRRKEEKRMAAMLSTLATGDYVLTNGGFYGVVIDISDDTVIVEFGSNKNCRIPMQKAAISRVEKANEA
ncbi:MAG: preprotein translocase subunit YajC [Lachnospiraceae bacterium]|jgi:preprotein translocase subunit YajC|nr:preprotein translocase subunit YajC [Lachnospiraceae bacterium]